VRRASRLPPLRAVASDDGLMELVSDPLLRRALREPVAFAGGMLAGAHTNTRTPRRHLIAPRRAPCAPRLRHARTPHTRTTRTRCAACALTQRVLRCVRTSRRAFCVVAHTVAFPLFSRTGFLKLDLAADPLADWVRRTAAVAGPVEAAEQQAPLPQQAAAAGGDSGDAATQ
jgi:hypothetical protein